MKKTFSAIFLVICVLITVFAPLCTVAEEPTEPAPTATKAVAEETEKTTANGYSDVVAVAPTPSNGLNNILIICAMGGLVILVCLIYIYRAKKQLSSPKE